MQSSSSVISTAGFLQLLGCSVNKFYKNDITGHLTTKNRFFYRQIKNECVLYVSLEVSLIFSNKLMNPNFSSFVAVNRGKRTLK